jgi:hypothetical protein
MGMERIQDCLKFNLRYSVCKSFNFSNERIHPTNHASKFLGIVTVENFEAILERRSLAGKV